MRRRFQFSLKWLLMAMLVVAAFFAGVRFEREWQRRASEAAALAAKQSRIERYTRIYNHAGEPLTITESVPRK